MSFDMFRLAVIYYPLTFVFAALLVGFFLRDVFDLLLRFARRRLSKA